jgi:ABC-2 type transport system ATP-binding protein
MIEVKNLCKNYGKTKALDSISFSVGKPEIVGFLGPNGAGKTTAMKIITTFIAPTSGQVLVDGVDVTADPLAVRKKIGYLPEKAPLYDDMVVKDYLRFVGEARQLSGELLQTRTDWVIKSCGLKPVLHKKIHMLSKGFRQRVGLAQAMIHDPEILILDEPTTGLDPLQIIGIRNLIQDLAKEKTIILSTHILGEITAVSDRVLVIHQGKVVADGKFEELKKTVVESRRLIVVAETTADFKKHLLKIKGVTTCEVIREQENQVFFSVGYKKNMVVNKEVSACFKEENVPLVALYDDEISMEDIFIALTQGKEENAA